SSEKYKDTKGQVVIGNFDFEYKAHNIVARGYVDYGYLSDADKISTYNKNLPNQSASPRSDVASNAIATGIEAGYDIFSQLSKLKATKQKLYLFGRYELYDSMYKTPQNILPKGWAERQMIVGGVNYFPLRDVVIKAEYSHSKMNAPFINENSINIGVAYAGFFTK
ncbi:MAG: hypothetical protein LBS07_04840, partial [Prevotellaceae bacterium]|nr:hypothetical protein [Prevotellaceae bacterium]